MTANDKQGRPLFLRVWVQGTRPAPFLRQYTVEAGGFFHILDLIAERMAREEITRWGVLSIAEAASPAEPTGSPSVLASEELDPLHIDPREVLIRPWGCFADGITDRAALAQIRPGYVAWEEGNLLFCQANLSAPELRRAFDLLLVEAEGPWRLVLEFDSDDPDREAQQLFYADEVASPDARNFLSRHGIWCLGDGFVGVGIVQLEPFREIFVDSHGELLIWWDPREAEALTEYLDSLGLRRFERGSLGFVSAQPHVHVEHEMTGPFEDRLRELVADWGFYEFNEERSGDPEGEEE